MENLTDILFKVSLPFVSISLILFIIYSLQPKRRIFDAATLSSLISFLLLTVVLLLLLSSKGFGLIYEGGARFVIFSWLIILVYFIAEWIYKVRMLGPLLMPVAMILLIVAMFTQHSPVTAIQLRPLPTFFHIAFGCIGLAFVFLAFAAAVMYLVKRRALKQHHGSAIDGELPALGKLERMMTHPFNAGFPVLTLGTILAVAYGSELGENWLTSSKIILGLAVWLVYGCLFILHRADKLLPRRLAQGIIFLFILCCFYYLFTIPKADQANRHKVEVEQAK